ncbi:MAG: hypothetical protein QM831_14580 [Kofleriaceae bacterium]
MWKAIFVLAAACGSNSPATGDDDASPDASTGSGGHTSDALYPFAAGNSWTFDVQAVGSGSICAAGSHEQHVVSTNPANGRAAFQLTSFCTGVSATYDYATTGDEVDFNYQGTWLVLVDPMLQEGHDWPYFNTSYHWHRETSVTVPAGTYDDCWTAVQDVSYTAYLTYCRGVGLVRSYSSDLTGSGWDAKLASSNL